MQFTSSVFVAFAALASLAAAAPTSPTEDVPAILAREAANSNLVKRCYIEGPNGCARCIQQYNLTCPFFGGATCSKGARKWLDRVGVYRTGSWVLLGIKSLIKGPTGMDYAEGGSLVGAARLWCFLLLTFAATLVFVPKHATLLRVGATLGVACFQYAFYMAIVDTSITPAQKSNICLLSWGFFMSSMEQILISQINTADLLTKAEKDGDNDVGAATLLFRAAGMYFNLRRVGVRGEISVKYRRTITRARFLYAKVAEVLVWYLIMDAAMSAPRPENRLVTRDKQTLFRLSNLSLEDLAFRLFSTLGIWLVTFVCNRLNHACAAVVSLMLGLSQPEDWPHLNGSISACYTVRGFWGKFWHQLYRKTFTSLGDFVPDRIFRLRRGTLVSRYTRLFLAFLMSGLMHHCIGHLYLFAADAMFASERFYAIQAVGIAFEDAVQAMTAHVHIPMPVRRVVGYIWVLVFLSWSTPISSYPSMRAGDIGQMVPFRVVDHFIQS
ncbi:hypothetical protein F53441_13407 [Fusarium austroafricanum]|uniref:Wax synthase domain-containing protein n=1 Tax=Fusarium austroafricanum TaxID=2364996 RepID=A0A8H4NFL8_9HYPO|nr:hypothetical protein F53441_13407 [Fusarium austroafricanum]